MIFYFSATGNCKYVAERIAVEFNDVAVSIEQSDGIITLKENEMLGFIAPVNWWELPVLMREFLNNLCICGTKPSYSYNNLWNNARLYFRRRKKDSFGKKY